MKFKKVSETEYLIRLDRGEEIIDTLTAFAKEHNIGCGVFSGLGSVENASIGNYNYTLNQYIAKSHKGMLEIGSLNGNISVNDDDGEVSLHCHVTAFNETDGVVVGHLFGATVKVTMEVYLRFFDTTMSRMIDPETEYRIWKI